MNDQAGSSFAAQDGWSRCARAKWRGGGGRGDTLQGMGEERERAAGWLTAPDSEGACAFVCIG